MEAPHASRHVLTVRCTVRPYHATHGVIPHGGQPLGLPGAPPRPSCPHREKYLTPALALSIPPVCLDVISLVASSCGYTRGEIEPRVAQSCTAHVATQRRRAERPPPRHPPCVQPVAPLWECHSGRPRLTPRRCTAQAHSAFPWVYRRLKPVNGARRVRSRAPHPQTLVFSLVSLYARGLQSSPNQGCEAWLPGQLPMFRR